MLKLISKAAVAAMIGTALIGAAGHVQAAMVSYLLDQTNASPTLSDGVSYLRVSIDDNTAGRLTFTVEVLPTLSSLAQSNFGLQSFGFNVLTGVIPIGDANGSNAQWSLPSGWRANVSPPPNQLDGFGRFEVQVSTTGSGRQSPLIFQLVSTPLAISQFAELSSGNAGEGNTFFAAHVTGFDAGGGVTSAYFGGSVDLAPIPLPASIGLLAMGLALGATRWRRPQRP